MSTLLFDSVEDWNEFDHVDDMIHSIGRLEVEAQDYYEKLSKFSKTNYFKKINGKLRDLYRVQLSELKKLNATFKKQDKLTKDFMKSI